jgi:hypothetical protein
MISSGSVPSGSPLVPSVCAQTAEWCTTKLQNPFVYLKALKSLPLVFWDLFCALLRSYHAPPDSA